LVEASDNTSNTSSNTCLNSLADKCRGIEARAYHIIDASEVELKPVEIARIIHSHKKPKEITPGQYTTVRVVCTKLLQKGLVLQPYPGSYCNKLTYRVRFVPLCVHNISLQSNVCQDIKHWETDEFVGGVKLHVCFGSERRKISGYIACDIGGMSHDACLFALNRWFDLVEAKLGFALSDLVLTTFEMNKDYHGVRVDGVQCITKRDLFGMIDRTYQKEESLIRKERKVTKAMSINKFEEALAKGFKDMESAQQSFELHKEVKENSEALKYNNSRLLQVERLTEAVYQTLSKFPAQKLDNFEATVQKFEAAAKTLAISADRINEALSRLGDIDNPKKLDEKCKLGEYVR
jgi:hypothetical protein